MYKCGKLKGYLMRYCVPVKTQQVLYLCVYTREVDYVNSHLVFREVCDKDNKEFIMSFHVKQRRFLYVILLYT
jgi:hypothetical protein